ncbi:MAG: glycosyltransferase [Candidatus Eisenbacteria bacterium]|nr:glycosyltransferase [Candidatus Eisenbacteria bacterium]
MLCRKKIVVVGYPLGRVGSSALMGLLERAGAHPGDVRFLAGSAPMNPKGFFELPAQEKLLREAWAGIYPHLSLPPSPAQTDAIGAEYAERYADLLAEIFGDADPIAVKSQWFLTLPFLHRLRDRYDVRLLSLERDTGEQIHSLLRVFRTTDRPPYQHADEEYVTAYIEQWRRFGRRIRENLSFPASEVRFEKLMADPVAVTEEICRFAGLETPPEEEILDWLDPSLVNRKTLEPLPVDPAPATNTAKRPSLSLVVNTRNEEANLEECLRSAAGAVDEIVVVDMESEDRTVEIARRFTDRVFTHPKTGVVEGARQFAIDKALGDWIFLLDADERATPELAAGLRGVIAGAGDTTVFRIPRRNRIAGRWFTGSGLGPDVERKLRLFRRGTVRWPARVHAVPETIGPERILPLPPEARIDHYAYPDLSSFVERLNRYTDHEARALVEAGASWSPAAMLEAMRREILFRYDPEKDGAHSLAVTGLMAFYRFAAWAKLWEIEGCPEAPLPADAAALGLALSGAEDAGAARGEDAAGYDESKRCLVGAGFHADEGGWRWMDREAILHVLGDDAPSDLRFTLACGEAEHYDTFPFDVRIETAGIPPRTVRFDRPGTSRIVRLDWEKTPRHAPVRLVSTASFVPAILGLNEDRRRLSVRISGIAVSAGAGVPERAGAEKGRLPEPSRA